MAPRNHWTLCDAAGLDWHPDSGRERSPELAALATGGADKCARVWSGKGQMLHDLRGHEERLGRLAFHPMGSHLGTASFDMTWRLWDLQTGQCLLEQEGHSRAVYALAFQQDGALAATGGLDAVGE